MSVARSKVGLCVGELKSETNTMFQKTCVYAFGGIGKDKQALKTVEQFNVKANVWRGIANLNIARSSASGSVMGDHLYVFGGTNESTIERFNLKSSMVKIVEQFELLDVKLPLSASEIGIIPFTDQELILIGGFGGAHNEKERCLN
jgi:hypothetical protein